jgi:hypothetical protein
MIFVIDLRPFVSQQEGVRDLRPFVSEQEGVR